MPVAPVPTPEPKVAPIPPKPVAQPPLPPVGPVPLPEVEVAKPQLEPLRVADLPPESPKPAAKALPSRPAPSQPAPTPPKPERSGLLTVLLVLVFLLLAVGVAVYLVIQQLSREPELLKMPPPVGASPISEANVFIVEEVPDNSRAVAGTRSYRLADPANSGDTARVNVKIDSEIGSTLSIINWRGTEENQPITRTATVELKWLGENHAPELVISRFICWEFLGLGGKETPATASTQ